MKRSDVEEARRELQHVYNGMVRLASRRDDHDDVAEILTELANGMCIVTHHIINLVVGEEIEDGK